LYTSQIRRTSARMTNRATESRGCNQPGDYSCRHRQETGETPDFFQAYGVRID
jgi:hypothetical protein